MKKFLSVWGRWDLGHDEYEPSYFLTDGSDFIEVNGFNKDDMKALDELEPGDRWDDRYGNHSIYRLE